MYTLYVSMASPYAMKASALMGYSGLPCRQEVQTLLTRYRVIKKLTGRTMVPTLREGQWAINDSTHIAEHVLGRAQRPMLPSRPETVPLCWLLEDFFDEWFVNWALLPRFTYPPEREETAALIGQELTGPRFPFADAVGHQVMPLIEKIVRQRGIREANQDALQNSRAHSLQALEEIFTAGPAYLFEGHPTVADFALFGPLVQARRGPLGRQVLRDYPAVWRYIDRLEAMTLPLPEVVVANTEPRHLSDLEPLFAEFIATYWKVLVANWKAVQQAKRPDEVAARLVDGAVFRFKPSNYMAGRLRAVLRLLDRRYQEGGDLFGPEGLRLEAALVSQLAELSASSSGRELLGEFPHIAR